MSRFIAKQIAQCPLVSTSLPDSAGPAACVPVMSEPRIKLHWSKRENDLKVNWDSGASSATARYLLGVISKDVLEELDRRGFDVTTIRFQIRKKGRRDSQDNARL